MKYLCTGFLLFLTIVTGLQAREKVKRTPFEIIRFIYNVQATGLEINPPTTLKDALHFIHVKSTDIQIDPPPPVQKYHILDLQLSESVLNAEISLHSDRISVLEAFEKALGGVPHEITFAPGTIIIRNPTEQQANKSDHGR